MLRFRFISSYLLTLCPSKCCSISRSILMFVWAALHSYGSWWLMMNFISTPVGVYPYTHVLSCSMCHIGLFSLTESFWSLATMILRLWFYFGIRLIVIGVIADAWWLAAMRVVWRCWGSEIWVEFVDRGIDETTNPFQGGYAGSFILVIWWWVSDLWVRFNICLIRLSFLTVLHSYAEATMPMLWNALLLPICD